MYAYIKKRKKKATIINIITINCLSSPYDTLLLQLGYWEGWPTVPTSTESFTPSRLDLQPLRVIFSPSVHLFFCIGRNGSYDRLTSFSNSGRNLKIAGWACHLCGRARLKCAPVGHALVNGKMVEGGPRGFRDGFFRYYIYNHLIFIHSLIIILFIIFYDSW